MKKAFSLVFMFLAFALLMVGCSDSPKTVAKKYVQALSNGDVAKIYSKEGKDPMILKKVNGDWKVDIEK